MNWCKLITVAVVAWIAFSFLEAPLHQQESKELATVAGVAGRHVKTWHWHAGVMALLVWHLLPAGAGGKGGRGHD